MAGNGTTEEGPASAGKPPHYHGHRQRLRERFRLNIETLPDYELLELVLCQAVPRRDTKPLAKELIETFGSFSEVIAAPYERLKKVKGGRRRRRYRTENRACCGESAAQGPAQGPDCALLETKRARLLPQLNGFRQ